MRTGSGLLRWAGVFGLYLLIAAVALVAVPAHWISVGGLWLIEKMASKANDLRSR